MFKKLKKSTLIHFFCLVFVIHSVNSRLQAMEDDKIDFFKLHKKAEKGDSVSQFVLGSYYEAESYAEAMKWYRLAADQNCFKAQYGIGILYYEGKGAQRDYAEAFKWFEKAANQNYDLAQRRLAMLYLNGEGIAQNFEESKKWSERAKQCNLSIFPATNTTFRTGNSTTPPLSSGVPQHLLKQMGGGGPKGLNLSTLLKQMEKKSGSTTRDMSLKTKFSKSQKNVQIPKVSFKEKKENSHARINNWSDFFESKHRLYHVGQQSFFWLDNQSLGKAAQVSQEWQKLALRTFVNRMHTNDEVRWHKCLNEMFSLIINPNHASLKDRNNKNTEVIEKEDILEDWTILTMDLPIVFSKSSYHTLPPDISKQIYNFEGKWIPYTQEGNHIVCRASKRDSNTNIEHSLYFKVYPELPGIEEAVGLLTRILLGYGAPHTELIKINATPILVSLSYGSKEKNLDFILRETPWLLNDLDEESLSGLILVAMLVNPEDGKPSNYVIENHPTKIGKYRVVGIDNDHAFVPAMVQENPQKEIFSRKPIPIAQVKTILYCLDQMNDPVHPTIRDIFINLSPEEVLENWLKKLKKINKSYSVLFPDSKERALLFDNHQSFIGIPFQKGIVARLYNKLTLLQESLNNNPQTTHLELLTKLEPRMVKKYQQVFVDTLSVKQRWDKVDACFYVKNKNGSEETLTSSKAILQSMQIPLEEKVFESIRKGENFSPDQALEELQAIRKELGLNTIEDFWGHISDLRLYSSLSKFLSTLDFKDCSIQEQKTILEVVLSYLAGKELRTFAFKNSSVLSDADFTQRLPLEHLLQCDLTGCEKITYRSLVTLSQTALALEKLNLSNIKTLKEIGNIGVFTDVLLVFKELRFLNLNNCIKLSKLLIQAPKLHWLSIENCSLLTDQILDGVIERSPKLQKLIFKGCPLIGDGNSREKYPNFPTSYWGDNKEGIVKILDGKGSEVKLNNDEFDANSMDSRAFTLALQIRSNLNPLITLDLCCNFGVEGSKILANLDLFSLKKLKLGHNNIKDEGVTYLANGKFFSLTTLNLHNNGITDKAAEALSTGTLTALTELDLGNNHIKNQGVMALARGKLTNLITLDLSAWNVGYYGGNNFLGITAPGIHTLTKNLTNLTNLKLGNNNIGNVGMEYFANGNLFSLTYLDLHNNNISSKEFVKGKFKAFENLIFLNLDDNYDVQDANYISNRLKSTYCNLVDISIKPYKIKENTYMPVYISDYEREKARNEYFMEKADEMRERFRVRDQIIKQKYFPNDPSWK